MDTHTSERMLKPSRLWLYRILTCWMPETRFFGLKAALLRWCGATIGRNVRINTSARFAGTSSLTIGDDVWIGSLSSISASAPVMIGSHVDLDAVITTGGHVIDLEGEHIAGEGRSRPVRIGSGCWICIKSLILSGVTVGEHAIVAAGAVVTKDVDPWTLVAGVPAERKKTLKES